MVDWLVGAVLLIAGQRFGELRLAANNRRWLLARGGREYGAGHYRLFVMLHAGWLTGTLAEGLWRGPGLDSYWPLWLGLFLVAQLLRYWCIVSLGRHWCTRILVISGTARIRRGPYRYIGHPNYLAVAIELAALPLVFGAWMTAATASLLNAWLLLATRIPAENEALTKLTE